MPGIGNRGRIAVRATETTGSAPSEGLVDLIKPCVPGLGRGFRVRGALRDAQTPTRRVSELSPRVKDLLLRALRAGIPLDQAARHARVSLLAVTHVRATNPAFAEELGAAIAYPAMLSRAVIKQEITNDWRLADKILRDSVAEAELGRLNDLSRPR